MLKPEVDTAKYYTPTGKEFHIGFEYEIWEDFDHYPENSWHKQVYGEDGFDQERMGSVPLNWQGGEAALDKFRVKFLDREDIESEGWMCTNSQDINGGLYDFVKGGMADGDPVTFNLRFVYKSRLVYIQYNNEDGWNTIFKGTINNKSELRKLMNQLGIK